MIDSGKRRRLGRPAHILRFLLDNSLLLVGGTLLALAWANAHPASYGRFSHALHFAVNDIGMAFFFAIAAKEVFEAMLPGGPLSSIRTAAVPLVSAVGGMVGPAALYLAFAAFAGMPELARGWAIPCATDIAFSYLVARVIFGAAHPAVPFLLMLAIADDAMGLVILALFYPSGPLRPIEFAILLAAALIVATVLRRRKIRSFWPYILGAGSVSWTAMYVGGLHPSLALVPVVPFMPHAARDLGVFDAREDRRHDTLNEFEHWWKVPVEVILLLFGLVNAGVPFAAAGVGTWVVLGAIVVGKPLGIAGAGLLARAVAPAGSEAADWRDVVVVGCVAGIGFTVALFFATASFPGGPLLDQTKMGALMSLSAAVVATVAARVLGVGRFARVTR